MPRAHRYYTTGLIWHLTHRCHKKEYLLNSRQDRRRYIHWLYEARLRYNLCVLNYCVTCNHIHLLIYDRGNGEISSSMRLMAGRTGQEYNIRRERKGAFWEDRYHATAVESNQHLLRCSNYIDFNMVRAGKVKTPFDWEMCGYKEIIEGKKRFKIIDREQFAHELRYEDVDEFSKEYYAHTQELLNEKYGKKREPEWSEAIAVGSIDFIGNIQKKIKYIKDAWARKAVETDNGITMLKEPETRYIASMAYIPEFGGKTGMQGGKQGCFRGLK